MKKWTTTTNQQAGFTLLESILVLVIFSLVLLFMPVSPLKQVQTSIESRMFFNQLESYINLAQHTAITQGTAVNVYFAPELNQIYTHTQASMLTTLAPLYLPTDWSLHTALRLSYLPNGRISQFKTVYFSHPDLGQVEFVPHLGSGRYEIRY